MSCLSSSSSSFYLPEKQYRLQNKVKRGTTTRQEDRAYSCHLLKRTNTKEQLRQNYLPKLSVTVAGLELQLKTNNDDNTWSVGRTAISGAIHSVLVCHCCSMSMNLNKTKWSSTGCRRRLCLRLL